jgi:predicted dithiol-disulfide oxidoreductase (DUF899 family)
LRPGAVYPVEASVPKGGPVDVSFPGESAEYRAARDRLLEHEAEMMNVFWNLFDYTPEGRGTDWYPDLSYD